MSLKDARIKSGLSQSEISERSGVNFRMIQCYEQETRDINGAKLKTLLVLCDVLGCSLRDLITDEETLMLMNKVGCK